MKIGEKRHIGDGVYVEYDGYHVVLKANSPDIPTDTIHLDAHVQIALRDILVELLPGKQEECTITCPKCETTFEDTSKLNCPECGLPVDEFSLIRQRRIRKE